MRAVLRRIARDALDTSPSLLEYGSIVVDTRRLAVRVGQKGVTLTPTEFRLLATMVREPGRTFTRDQIIDQVFGYDFDGFDRTVDAHVSSLRRKIEADPRNPRYIHTVYGVGYRFGDE